MSAIVVVKFFRNEGSSKISGLTDSIVIISEAMKSQHAELHGRCFFYRSFMFRQLETGIENCIAFRQGLKQA